jgi:EmrB/QacA subfamily drug resistance transporter
LLAVGLYSVDMTKTQRLVLVISILASFVAFLDGSVVNVALPAISQEFGGGFIIQQWVTDAYLITLGSLILIAGSLSDVFGRKKILVVGLIGFMITSLLCAAAPNGLVLVIARALQGVAGALLVPSSLALIISAISGPAQGKAIGSWTAWTGVAFIMGPLLGGFLVDVLSWRWIFAINVLPIGLTLFLLNRLRLEETTSASTPIDVRGAVLGAIGLGGPVYALIEQSRFGWGSPLVYGPLAIGLLSLALFVRHERKTSAPMLPLELFQVRNFSVGNIATLAIYAGLSVATFLLTIFLQQVGGYSAIEAGLALLPVTIIMFVLSPRFGALAGKFGPRLFMATGPIIGGLGFLYFLQVDSSAEYWTQIFPGVLMFGLGLSITVAPLTAAILGAIESKHAGVASAVNNAISRVAGLLAIAALGVIVGTTISLSGFHRGMVATAILLILGGVISAVGIQNPKEAKPVTSV